MTDRLGVLLVGCGNIAGRYAEDLGRRPHLRLVAVTDADHDRARAFAQEHGTRAVESLDGGLRDPEVALVVNLTSHDAHVPVSLASLRAGRHVYSEKPMALTAADARLLIDEADRNGASIGAAPIVAVGELAQTARRWVEDGRLGTVRLAYAEVNWGRIEDWHPAPGPFYDVGPLVDVGIYPLTLLTGILGPVARVWADGRRLLPERRTTAGDPFTIGRPDHVVAVCELANGTVVRLTANFYVPDPARQRGVELHGDDGSLWLSNWFQFGGTLEHAPRGEPYRPVPLLRAPEVVMPWAFGADELAAAALGGRAPASRPEHAAHVIDVIETILRAAEEERPLQVASRFTVPSPPAWTDDLAIRT